MVDLSESSNEAELGNRQWVSFQDASFTVIRLFAGMAELLLGYFFEGSDVF